VSRVVIVPPSWKGDRNDLGLAAARRHPKRFAVMGRLAIECPEAGHSWRTGRSSRDAPRGIAERHPGPNVVRSATSMRTSAGWLTRSVLG